MMGSFDLRASWKKRGGVSICAKAEALCKVLQPTSETDPLPAQRIRPSDGTVKWLVDRSAARLCSGA